MTPTWVLESTTTGLRPYGSTVLLLACDAHDADTTYSNCREVELLLKKRDRSGIVRSLLQRGCQTESRGRHGNTPFILAASRGLVDICYALRQNGCDVHAVDSEGKNAYDKATLASGTVKHLLRTSFGCRPTLPANRTPNDQKRAKPRARSVKREARHFLGTLDPAVRAKTQNQQALTQDLRTSNSCGGAGNERDTWNASHREREGSPEQPQWDSRRWSGWWYDSSRWRPSASSSSDRWQ